MTGLAGQTTLRIAWRNLWRNQRRTWLALVAIGLSVTLVLAFDSIIRAYGIWMLDAITGPMVGHVQVHAAGWRADRSMDRTIRGASGVLNVVRQDGNVADATPRVYAPALAALGQEGTGVIIVGLDVAAESGRARLFAAGQVLPAGQVLVGRALADQMAVKPGDLLAIVGQGVDGSVADALLEVYGVADTTVDALNRQAVIMHLDEAQTLFSMTDEVHEIIVHVRNADAAEATAKRLAALPLLAGFDVLDWRGLAPELDNLLSVYDAISLVTLTLVFIAAAAGVANTMVMATFERTHEFGMLLALGTSPGRIVRMIVAESVALGVVGAVLGAGAGVLLVAIFGRTGVDLAGLSGGPREMSAVGLRFSMVFHPVLATTDVIRAVGAVLGTAVLASLWPAVRAARLEPVRALRE